MFRFKLKKKQSGGKKQDHSRLMKGGRKGKKADKGMFNRILKGTGREGKQPCQIFGRQKEGGVNMGGMIKQHSTSNLEAWGLAFA